MTKETIGWVAITQTEHGPLFLNEAMDGLTSNLAKAYFWSNRTSPPGQTAGSNFVFDRLGHRYEAIKAKRIVTCKLELL